ncbi:ATP synthase-coupling factor 6, mitochondrial-like [Prorops nasuta]|uniref:ATP synthase-coupling factor 6, mitochondrial-like n=1 Tax=Prorops nasuta TaxID=863751 RepID=UPI0034CDD8E0
MKREIAHARSRFISGNAPIDLGSLLKMLRLTIPSVSTIVKRNIGISAPILQKASDPIQQLFLDKIKEYRSKGGDSKLVDPTPGIERERAAELEKVAKQYGGGPGINMSEFPKFTFTDPKVEVEVTQPQ